MHKFQFAQHDMAALFGYIAGAQGSGRVARLLNLERRAMDWALAMDMDRSTSRDVLRAHWYIGVVRDLLAEAQAPRAIWTGPDLVSRR